MRKFFCRNNQCQRRIFTERIPTIAAPWARRTQRLAQQLAAIALALGGAAGARLSQQLSCKVSRNTLLRLVLRLPLPTIAVPHSLGIDDFAFRKYQRYGSILVDLDKRRPIALLKDRKARTVAEWLNQHPGTQVLSRDRSQEYKGGMTEGAPKAIQVADRFHLLQNLAEVLEQVLGAQGKALKAVDTAQRLALATKVEGVRVVPIGPPATPPKLQQLSQQRRAQRWQAYQRVWELHHQGWSTAAIAQQVGLSSRTVRRYLSTSRFPERQSRSDRGTSLINPYQGYLLQQWNQGHRRVKRLFREIQQQGYSGSYMTVNRYVHRMSQAQGIQLRQYPTHQRLPQVVNSQRLTLTARRATWLILRKPENRTCEDKQLVARLREQHPELSAAIDLAQGFAQLVRQRQPAQLDSWLTQAGHCNLIPFQRFARSLQEDYEAVKAGVTLPVSNGPVEGHINRLKMLKRQMYGRAGIELLSRRFLLAS